MCFDRTRWHEGEADDIVLPLLTCEARRGREAIAGGAPLYDIWLDPASPTSMWEQLYEQLRRAIVAGRLKPGMRLPATRLLAGELKCSRNTVLSAFEQLIAEGYVSGKCGSGTFIAENLPDARGAARPVDAAPEGLVSRRGLSPAGHALSSEWQTPTGRQQAFTLSQFDPTLFPIQTWERLCQAWRKPKTALLSHADPGGYWPLRDALCKHLRAARSIVCRPDNIIITSGRISGLEAAIRLLSAPGDSVWIEDPISPHLFAAVQGTGTRIVPVGLDGNGMLPVCDGSSAPPSIVVATPAHQFPSGVVMSAERRHAILGHATACDAWVIENDWAADFRFDGPPLPALHTLDTQQRVIYAGSLSDLLFPALRVGFLIVPDRIADAFGACLSTLDNEPSVFVQSVLSGFIREGYFAAHVRKLRNTYRQRQAALVDAANRHLGEVLRLEPSGSGTHLVARLANERSTFRPDLRDVELAERIAREDVTVHPLSRFFLQPTAPAGLILGFSAVGERAIGSAVERLARAVS